MKLKLKTACLSKNKIRQTLITGKMKNVNNLMRFALAIVLIAGLSQPTIAQTAAINKSAPDALPGDGLKRYDFFYAGEAKARNMYIVRNGKINWSYIDTTGKGEISDAIMMASGNVLFAHQFGITLINKDKKVLWHYDAPSGFETHTAQMIGTDRVVFVQNGNPAKVFITNIKTNKVEKEFVLPFKSGTHGQVRHARLTAAGTLLVAHMDLGKVNEYDTDGKILMSIDAPGAWSGVEIKNGNILIASNDHYVREVTHSGAVVWNCDLKELPDYKIAPQVALRLPNGNTLVNSWFNQWDGKVGESSRTVQAIELTADKKIVWALRSWEAPANLGPATIIQLLKDPNNATYEKAYFGNIK
ncbi:hypothetical protein [Pedobacter sp. JCM 36344]|uniref:beta-propeller domain-containing protein n=1 Tax=Pedobacter sp. JCM 36344 TaxID=3374280 RepID=UPI00397E2903